MFCPHRFKVAQLVVGRAGRDDDARCRGAAMSCDEAFDGLFVGFAAGHFDDVRDGNRAAKFKPGDATFVDCHVMRAPQVR